MKSIRPNTAPIGNWGLISALQYLQDESLIENTNHALPKISSIMGKGKRTQTSNHRPKKVNTSSIGSKAAKGKKIDSSQRSTSSSITCARSSAELSVTSSDTEEEITAQWNRLTALFNDHETALIFHLKNHYALIFAMREWSMMDPMTSRVEITREVLTSRRGQRPSAWISFTEVREIVMSWEGYKILAVRQNERTKSEDRDATMFVRNIRSIKGKILARRSEEETIDGVEVGERKGVVE